MFHPWQSKHSTVCDLKRLAWEGHGRLLSIVWTVRNLLEEAPTELATCAVSESCHRPGQKLGSAQGSWRLLLLFLGQVALLAKEGNVLGRCQLPITRLNERTGQMH